MTTGDSKYNFWLRLQLFFTFEVLVFSAVCNCTTLYPKRFLQNVDSLAPSISLNMGRNYAGKELFFDGTMLSIPQPRVFRSHRFTGKINWSLYPNTNFSGQPTCLVADQGFPVTYNGDFDVLVGSVRRGCWCNYSITVTPKPRAEIRTGAIRLFSRRNGNGVSVFTDGQETRLPEPISANSFELLGPFREWTGFSQEVLTGDPKCMSGSRRTEAYTNTPSPFVIQSLQQGCIPESAKFETFDPFDRSSGGGGGGAGNCHLAFVTAATSLLIINRVLGLQI